MSDLRKMARDAGFNTEFDDYVIDHWKRFEKLAELIKDAALAQPEQTAMPPDIAKVLFDNVESLYVADDLPQLTKWTPMAEYAAKSAAVPGRAEALKQAGYTRRPRQLQKEDEPVAWMNEHGHIDRGLDAILDPTGWTPLYSAPPQRKPLTEEQIYEILGYDNQHGVVPGYAMSFVRAVEKAHGIGGES